jgi:hypothetical protein
MSLVIDEKMVGIWYLHTLPTQDWMATVRELVPDEKYELTYRFSYYKDDKVFDSDDKKNWYRGEVSGTRNYVILSLRSAAKMLAMVAVGKVYELLNDGDLKEFMNKFQDAPFVFMRQVSKEEYEKEEAHDTGI